VPADVKALLQKFPSILRTGDVKPRPTHGVRHHIHTGSHPPVFAKPCRLNPEKLQIAQSRVQKVRICWHHSKLPWASPLHIVPKKDGSWRPCGDYRHLNLVTTPDKCPLSNMQEISKGLHGCSVFKNRSCQGLSPNPCRYRGHPKTAIISPFGLFEYLFTPFELSNATQTFQRMMDQTTDGLEGVFAYMDESLVGSPDRQTHLRHLEAFFNALATNGLALTR
jgi:hypothetical protein